MDLSNLRTSLREEEVSGQRRTAHLRAAEDELNAFFRSSALGLTTLYRQGVAATKASYEKGYAHALAHVLELWDKDQDWLKGYLQRRIEAIEATDAEDDGEEVQLDQPQPRQQSQQQQQQPQQQPQQPSEASTSFTRANNTHMAATRPVQTATDSSRQTNKRSRNAFSDASTSSSHRDHDDASSERRSLHRMPQHSSSAPSSRFPASPAANFASNSFNFSAPLAYPSSSSNAANPSTSSSSPSKTGPPRSADAPVIKTSNPATSRRRLQKLKGLRAGRDRIVEIEQADEDEILPDGAAAAEDADAWTDDEDAANGFDNASPTKGAKSGNGGRGKKVVVWAERSGSNSTHGAHIPQVAEGKILERLDRRKRRRSNKPEDAMMADEEVSSAEVSREEEGAVYRYHS
ncbi:uncharacterized protein SPSC_00388 [Sporisorium scitamineum]|uniref:Uncharacterized protein n=1 Tax=Sporisorium scitamineum TaxID=49012 RepID=A0A140KMD1_9BASI|nr:uncharacterized protein SPSC_00388 [Sporisorium scitamineum]